MASTDHTARTRQIDSAYHLANGIYLLGVFERGVTVYKQQVRAHNLAWALWELDRSNSRKLGRTAIVGGGIAGLTVAAALYALFKGEIGINLFEKYWDLCPLQQGSDTRWLHPRIYDWPTHGSRAPGASLPVLNWSEGRASDVSRSIVNGFGTYCEFFGKDKNIDVVLGLSRLKIDADNLSIDWLGTKTKRSSNFFHLDSTEGNIERFDTIIIASGFGIETTLPSWPENSYWRNERIAQPVLDRDPTRYLLSGYGDGGLTDLFRLKIERFRQDTLVYDLFGRTPDDFEEIMRKGLGNISEDANLFQFFQSIDETLLGRAKNELRHRLRKDTIVTLEMAGRNGNNTTIKDIFGPTSSKLNRLLAYLLYRLGAFSISFDSIDSIAEEQHIPPEGIIIRRGTNTTQHICNLFLKFDGLKSRLQEIKTDQSQHATRLWRLGAFPVIEIGEH